MSEPMKPSASKRLQEAERAASRKWDDEQHDKPWPLDAGIYLQEGRLAAIEAAYNDGIAAGRAEVVRRIEGALDLGGRGHALHNLDAAIIDIDHTEGIADSVCMNTLRRVRGQLAEVESIIADHFDRKSPKGGSDAR